LFPTDIIASGIVSLRSVFVEANGDVAGTAFDAALSRDISRLANSVPTAFDGVPLWNSSEPPGWEVRRWNTLKGDLLNVGHGWEVWVGYEVVLRVALRSEAHELAYGSARRPVEEGDPARVNTDYEAL
jgi:hypothetical protein